MLGELMGRGDDEPAEVTREMHHGMDVGAGESIR
jgi:hypothetical protein